MSTIVLRSVKGSPLTHNEVDDNFNNLNVDKIQSGDTVAGLTITSLVTTNDATINGQTVGRGNNNISHNTTLGENSLGNITTGNFNVAVGRLSGEVLTSGGQNTLIGQGAGRTLTTGTNNTCIGQGAEPSLPNISHEVTIGNDAVTVTRLKGKVGIGLTPTCKLQLVYNSTAAYSTSLVGGSGFLPTSSDGIAISNNDATVSNGYTSLHFHRSGVGGNAAGKILLGNAAGGSGFFAFQLRDASHTSTINEKMRINSNGNVGIGTSSPVGRLSVFAPSATNNKTIEINGYRNFVASTFGATSIVSVSNQTRNSHDFAAIRFEQNPDTSNGHGALFRMYVGGESSSFASKNEFIRGTAITTTVGVDNIQFRTANAERVRIKSNGDVLVGTTTDIVAGSEGIKFRGDLGVIYTARNTTGASSHIVFYNPNGIVGSIQTAGSATNYVTSSDYRLKENITPMSGSIDRLKKLKPSTWSWKTDGSHGEGFIAHEAQTVVPTSVTGTKDAMCKEEYEVTPAVLNDDGKVVTKAIRKNRKVPDYQGIDQSKLVPLLTAALQEAITKIEDLEARVTQLENN